jgi:enoyl-CoA hydratase
LTGELVTPDRLAATGWIHQVVSDADLSDTATAVARELAGHHGAAQSAFKRSLFDLTTTDSRHALAAELDAFDAHWRSSDVPASLRAFLDRRTSRANSTTL